MAISPTREEYMTAFRGAPELVREATLSDDTVTIIDEIRVTNSLHIDNSGQVGRLLNYLLLGIIEPERFKKELLEMGLGEAEASLMLNEINEKVFKPLQKRMRDGVRAENDEEDAFYDPYYETTGTQEKEVGVISKETKEPLLPVMYVGQYSQVPKQGLVYTNTHPVMSALNSPVYNHPAEFVTPQQIQVPKVTTPIVQASDLQTQTPNEPYLPYARTMAEDMERAARGLTGTPASPARSFQTASVPVTFAQPQPVQAPAPSALPPQTTPTYTQRQFTHPAQPQYTPVSAPIAPQPAYQSQFSTPQQVPVPNYATPTPPPTPPPAPIMAPVRLTPVDRTGSRNAPIMKEFGSDPYREPISELA